MKNWILASSSPRRQELLKKIIPTFDVFEPDVDELDAEVHNPRELVLHNAELKFDCAINANADAYVIAADTTVALGNRIFNKPQSMEDACRMLKELSGRTHHVYTAVSCGNCEHEHAMVGVSEVTFLQLSEETILRYLGLINPLDKAGSYAIQSSSELIIGKWSGSLDNIIGLPTELLKQQLVQMRWIDA